MSKPVRNRTLPMKLKKQYGECVACGNKYDLEAHHIKSLYDGGLDVVENMQILCYKCHAEVHGRTITLDENGRKPNVNYEEVKHHIGFWFKGWIEEAELREHLFIADKTKVIDSKHVIRYARENYIHIKLRSDRVSKEHYQINEKLKVIERYFNQKATIAQLREALDMKENEKPMDNSLVKRWANTHLFSGIFNY